LKGREEKEKKPGLQLSQQKIQFISITTTWMLICSQDLLFQKIKLKGRKEKIKSKIKFERKKNT